MNFRVVSRRTWLLLAVAIMLIGVAGFAVASERDFASAHAIDSRSHSRDVVIAVARQAAIAFTSYDYQHLDQSFKQLQDVATSDFYQQFLQAADQLRQIMLQKQASSSGKVVEIAIQNDPEGSSATVLAAADATVRNADVPQGAVQRFRLRIELNQVDRVWRVKAITLVV